MKVKALALFILVLIFTLSTRANDAKYLIGEMEKLRDSLELDDPARIDLTLRLADLYFDVSIKEGDRTEEQDFQLRKEQRLKALNLYETSLTNLEKSDNVDEITKLKVNFQMARLLSRLEEYERAETYYIKVQSHKEVPQKMKEQASLALAEWYEEDAKYEKSKHYYDVAISLCQVKSSCNYAHYRKAWLYFKDTKLEEATNEMRLSLWATEDEVRESSLQDLMLFMSNADTDGLKELEEVRAISEKLNRPELVQSLVEAFYVAGNRRAGSNLLSYINDKTPSLYFETRLLEEFYGFRKWEKVEKLLGQMGSRTTQDIPAKVEHAKEVKKIFRRYLVQVDSEANVAPELNNYLKQSIDIYLSIYPNDDLRKKLQQGWLNAEEDRVAKIERLGKWIKEDIAFGFKPEEIRKLRQTRLAMAQKETKTDVIVEESLAIAEILKESGKTVEAEEFYYVAAREMYGQKKFDEALPLFKGIVERSVASKTFPQWALLSQNLILDIYNGKNDYPAILAQVDLWRGATEESKDKTIQKDNAEMDKLKIDARFALAAKMKDSPESLKEFYNFCFKGIYPEKSCSNAKVLAIRFEDQGKLISLLEKEGDEKALMTEYELMGRFSDAAKLQEKLIFNKQAWKSEYEELLKTALLYELDSNFEERDRVLKIVMQKMKLEKSVPEKLEGAIFLTLDEAGLIDQKALFLPWSLNRKLSLAKRLELTSPNQANMKLIMAQSDSQGPLWSREVLKKFVKPLKDATDYKFYGRYSQYRFKKRTQRIDEFVKLSKKYLDGSDLETRVYILDMVTRVYQKMVDDILATPLPEGLDEATMAQVTTQLNEMTIPFETVRSDYERLKSEQFAQLEKEDQAKALAAKENMAAKPESYVSFIKLDEAPESSLLSREKVASAQALKEQLKIDPDNAQTISALRNTFKELEMVRLEAYYTGRLESLPAAALPQAPEKAEGKKEEEIKEGA